MNIQKTRALLVVAAFFGLALLWGSQVYAQGCSNPNDILGVDCGEGTGLTKEDPRILAIRIINFVLTFLGLIAVCIVLYAGFTWMTAGGNDEKVGSAKKMLISAVIGLIIIFTSYAITSYIIRALCATTGSCGPSFG